MSIELTEPQQRALDAGGGTPRVTDPRTNAQYVLVPAAEFEAVREVLDDERRRREIRRIGRRNAAGLDLYVSAKFAELWAAAADVPPEQ